MFIVADSGPLILLAKTGRFTLLRDLFGKVIVPETVYREVVVQGAGRAGALEVAQAVCIERDPDSPSQPLALQQMKQGAGERAALAVALPLHADVVLCGDGRGRRTARELGVAATGTLGVLVLAGRRELALDPLAEMDAAVAAGRRISPASLARAKALVGG